MSSKILYKTNSKKLTIKYLGRGEICAANFLPPVNSPSFGRKKIYVYLFGIDVKKILNILFNPSRDN